MKRLLLKRWAGVLPAEVALSPYTILAIGVAICVLIMAGSFIIQILYCTAVSIFESRQAAIQPDMFAIQERIYDILTLFLPAQSNGQVLLTTSDIQIDQFDGPYVTTSVHYQVMLPGSFIWSRFGISPSDMIIPWDTTWSATRQF